MKGPRQKRTGLIATARESLCHDRSVYNALVFILKSQDCDTIAHARYITHWFLYLKAKIVILLHMQRKKVNLEILTHAYT